MSIEFSQELDAAPSSPPALTGLDTERSISPQAPGRLHRPGKSQGESVRVH